MDRVRSSLGSLGCLSAASEQSAVLVASAGLLPAANGSNGLPLEWDGGGDGDVLRVDEADEAVPRGLVGRQVVAPTDGGLEAPMRAEERAVGAPGLLRLGGLREASLILHPACEAVDLVEVDVVRERLGLVCSHIIHTQLSFVPTIKHPQIVQNGREILRVSVDEIFSSLVRLPQSTEKIISLQIGLSLVYITLIEICNICLTFEPCMRKNYLALQAKFLSRL